MNRFPFAFLWTLIAFALLAYPQPAAAQPGIVLGLAGKCLDVLEANPADGTPLVLFPCTGNLNQSWSVETVGSQVRLRGLADKCLRAGAVGPGGLPQAEIGSCDGSAALWILSGWFPEYFTLAQIDSGRCLDVLGSSVEDKTPIVIADCTGNANQTFGFRPRMISGPPLVQPGAMLGIDNVCLDVLGASAADGTPVVIFGCTGNANQTWTFELVGDRLRLRGLGDKCLRPGPVGASGFIELVIGTCDDGAALWDLAATESAAPAFALAHVDTGQCLDVLGSSTADKTPTILFNCTGNPNQAWRFDPRPVAGRCIPSQSRLCLNGNRFQVEATWRDSRGRTGIASALPLSVDDSGLLWFFRSDNLEMLVKVLDNCNGPTNRFWVFAAATTNVEYTLRITDTFTGAVREYHNPLGVQAAAITDTDAFATCP
ncbi:MAG: hypothetical protein D6696_01675 [Acidobacteria bacterium]|nr:MAG: hypothetical protein D6696_01675 [Acidobacteriota bacterium]